MVTPRRIRLRRVRALLAGAVCLGAVAIAAPTAGYAASAPAPRATGATPAAAPAAADDPTGLRFYQDSTVVSHIVQRTFQGRPVGQDPVIVQYLYSSDPSPVHITVTSEDGALSVDASDYDVDLAPGADGPYYAVLRIHAEADAPGLHPLRIDAEQSTPTGPMTATIRLDRIWAAGAAQIPGSDSLAGQQYRIPSQVGDLSCRGCAAHHPDEFTFVDATHAVVGAPPSLRGACATGRCVPYEYDAASGLVQIGDLTLGNLVAGDIFLSALPAVPGNPATFVRHRLGAYVVARPGQRFHQAWVLQGVKGTTEHLRLTGAGRYTFSLHTSQRHRRFALDLAGRYRVVGGGVLQLRDRTGRRVLQRTLLSLGNPRGDGSYVYGALVVDHTFARQGRRGHRVRVYRNEGLIRDAR